MPKFLVGDEVRHTSAPDRIRTIAELGVGGVSIRLQGDNHFVWPSALTHVNAPAKGDLIRVTTVRDFIYNGQNLNAETVRCVEVLERAQPIATGCLVKIPNSNSKYRVVHVDGDAAWIKRDGQVPVLAASPKGLVYSLGMLVRLPE